MTISLRKAQLRREIKARIAALSPAARGRQELRLASRLAGLPDFQASRVVLMYATAFRDEIDTAPLLLQALESGKRLVCPKIDPGRPELMLREVADLDRDLVPSDRAIPEPTARCRAVDLREVDWALVPGLAFDRLGYRLGRGGGYYDRLLPRLRSGVACWALILDVQWVEEVPREPHDEPVTGVMDHREIRSGRRS